MKASDHPYDQRPQNHQPEQGQPKVLEIEKMILQKKLNPNWSRKIPSERERAFDAGER